METSGYERKVWAKSLDKSCFPNFLHCRETTNLCDVDVYDIAYGTTVTVSHIYRKKTPANMFDDDD